MSEELRLRPSDLSWRKIDDEVVAVDVAASSYMCANPAGAMLWEMLAGGATRAALSEQLVQTFEIDPQRAEADVDAFVDQLVARNLLA
jgi:hypothetical protein